MAERMAEHAAANDDTPAHNRVVDRVFALAEDVVYGGIAILLIATAVVLLGRAAGELFRIGSSSVQDVSVEVLDLLLLVFIVVELLFAVRTTLSKRELVAEPFLLVGIIASIKEIVVLSVKAAEEVGKGAVFDDQLLVIGVLGVLVLLLGITAWLLRLKEREPDEGENPDGGSG
jgi:uncharacterized membrane protein (DUF373 family)